MPWTIVYINIAQHDVVGMMKNTTVGRQRGRCDSGDFETLHHHMIRQAELYRVGTTAQVRPALTDAAQYHRVARRAAIRTWHDDAAFIGKTASHIDDITRLQIF